MPRASEHFNQAEFKLPILTVAECPVHHGFVSLCVDTNHGGVRVFGGKCCGQWKVTHWWAFNHEQADELHDEMLSALEQMGVGDDAPR